MKPSLPVDPGPAPWGRLAEDAAAAAGTGRGSNAGAGWSGVTPLTTAS